MKRIEEERGKKEKREKREREIERKRNAVKEEAFTRHLDTCGCNF